MSTPIAAALTYIGISKEVTLGTPVAAPAFFIPANQPQPEQIHERIRDEAYDNNISAIRGVYDGVADSTFDFDGPLYPDAFGYLLAATGLTDTKTGTGPVVHTFKLAAGANQPPSYTLYHFNGVEVRAYPGMMLDSLEVKIGATGMVTYSAKWKGWKSSTVTTPSAAFTAVKPFVGWQGALTIGGATVDRLMEETITITRGVDTIHTINGSQSPSTTFAGQLTVTRHQVFLFADNTEWNHLVNNDQNAVVTTIQQPAAGPSLVLTSTVTAWMKAPSARGQGAIMQLEADLECVQNATDGGPIAAVLTNSIATAY